MCLLFRLIGISLMFLYGATGRAESLDFTKYDKQAHGILAYQATSVLARILEASNVPKVPAIAIASTVTLTAAIVKELAEDSHYQPADIWAGGVGILSGVLLSALIPSPSLKGRASIWTLESEAGLVYITPIAAKAGLVVPPSMLVLQGQTTVWYDRRVGFHSFTGGYGDAADSTTNSGRLIFGLGARLGLGPILWADSHAASKWAAWVGLDRGFLYYESENAPTAYPHSGYATFGSLGVSFSPFKDILKVAAQVGVIPFNSRWLLNSGLQLGLEF